MRRTLHPPLLILMTGRTPTRRSSCRSSPSSVISQTASYSSTSLEGSGGTSGEQLDLRNYMSQLSCVWSRLWGEKVNLREQHDAFEFFNCLLDSLDEGMKEYCTPSIPVSKVLGGSFADQKICKGCPHR